uniref:Uncharacterized protein n=1 Tax=Romanomermis culicivorax TaxID=13658 RepID=A0A915HLM7_ROMCU
DASVPIDRPPAIAIKLQDAGPVNSNPDANGLLLQNIKRSPPRVELAGPKRDVVMNEIRPSLDEERAPKISHQELVTQLCKLKGTVEALFDIIANATTEDNKTEADSHRQELDGQ